MIGTLGHWPTRENGEPGCTVLGAFPSRDRNGGMVRLSTVVVLVGVVLLFVPIPPIATILGVLTILTGVGLRFFAGK